MEKDYKKLIRLSQVLNSTFGSDGPGHQHINGMNVTLKAIDSELIKAMCIMTVTYRSDKMRMELQRKHREEALAMIKGALERAAEDYKAQYDEKISLVMDDDSFSESTEIIHVSQYSALTRGFYRVTALIQVK